MLDTLEFVLRILFFILSIIWAGKIMILRTDKQIVINPLLIIISSLLVILPPANKGIELLGMSIQNISLNLANSDFENVTTEYEEKFMSQGLKIFRCEAKSK